MDKYCNTLSSLFLFPCLHEYTGVQNDESLWMLKMLGSTSLSVSLWKSSYFSWKTDRDKQHMEIEVSCAHSIICRLVPALGFWWLSMPNPFAHFSKWSMKFRAWKEQVIGTFIITAAVSLAKLHQVACLRNHDVLKLERREEYTEKPWIYLRDCSSYISSTYTEYDIAKIDP